MVALRYICGFFLQILPYAFFCIYPFRNRFRIDRKKTVFIVLSVMTVLVIPFCLIGQFNVGGDYEEFLCNIVFYIALIFFLVLYMVSFRAAISEKLFVFFIVMSYGFLVTRLISLMCTAFDLMIDKFMYPPKALLLILLINLISAKPIMLLMERVRMMVDAKLEKRIWRLLCLIPVLFVPLTSGAYFSEIAYLGTDFLIPIYSILFTLFAFIVYAVIFRVMAYVCRQQEEYRASELMLEGYRSQAENNEKIHEIHHEIKHHLSALSAYLAQKDYNGAEQYLKKFAEDAEQLPSETYTAHPLINSILSGFAKRAQKDGTRTDFSIIVDCKLNIDDVDLCRILANILENALEGCEKVAKVKRFIRLKLHSKGNFLYLNCENSCDEKSLKLNNGRYVTTKKEKYSHGYGLKITGQIAEKYNGILTTQMQNGVFTATTNLCLVETSEE